jgi:hypothetical protein
MTEVIDLSEEEDVIITDVRQVAPTSQAPQRQRGVTIQLPDGPLLIPGEEEPAPERASFANAMNPVRLRLRRAAPTRRQTRNAERQDRRWMEQRLIQRRALQEQRHMEELRTMEQQGRLTHNIHTRQPFMFNMFRFFQEYGHGNDYDEDDDPDYHPRLRLNWGTDNGDQVSQELLDMIQRREDAEFDRKRSRNLDNTTSVQKEMDRRISLIKEPFTTKIDPEEEYVCCLCAVKLGEGLPQDFSGNKLRKPLAALQEQDDVQAPYRAMDLITDADRDLSKRIFIAACGHTYCGRCVKNISGVRAALKESKKKFRKAENDIKNPFIYAPGSCVGPGCMKRLMGKKAFVEMFL